MNNRFSQRVVLVTGSSRGIGRATAAAFASEGARVIVNYRSNDAAAQETLSQINIAGGLAWLMRADISHPDEVRQLVENIEHEVGPIDVLVNNGAAFYRHPFLDVDLDELDRVWGTNVRGLFYLSQVVAREMAARHHGAIVHVSSILARLAISERTVYCASKGAVESLTRAMAIDLAPYNIRVNAVSPGLIRTKALLDGMPDPMLQAEIQKHIPSGRFGNPEEVANAILFLASDEASYVNGVVLPVDSAHGSREAGPIQKP